MTSDTPLSRRGVFSFRLGTLIVGVVLASLGGQWIELPARAGVILTDVEMAEASRITALIFGGLALVLGLPGLRWPRIGSGVVLLAGFSVLAGLRPGVETSVRPPDLILITLDTVRADAFDFTGGEVVTAATPSMSALAHRSQVFRQAYSPAAITGPAHTSLLSGQHPLTHGVLLNGEVMPEVPWVPTLLQAAGWHTEAWVSAAILEPSLGFGRGFSRFDSAFEERIFAAHPLLPAPDKTGFSRRGAQTLAGMLAARRPVDQKVFTWIHFYDAHWPYTPTIEGARAAGLDSNTVLEPKGLSLVLNIQEAWSEADQSRGRALYRAEIADVDALIGTIVEAAPEASIVIVADHGESLGEHGLLFSHGKLAFAPDTHVPLLISSPQVPAGVSDVLVESTSVAPTLLSLAGLVPPQEMTAISLLEPQTARPLLSLTVSDREPVPVFGHYSSVVIREDGRSVGISREHPIAGYDRLLDPRELSALPTPSGDPHVQTIEALLSAGIDPAEQAEGMEDALRALGYIE